MELAMMAELLKDIGEKDKEIARLKETLRIKEVEAKEMGGENRQSDLIIAKKNEEIEEFKNFLNQKEIFLKNATGNSTEQYVCEILYILYHEISDINEEFREIFNLEGLK